MSDVLAELPETVKIGFANWKIEVLPHIADNPDIHVFGLCEKHSHTIKYAEGYDDVQTRNTVIHEILHAIWYERGLVEPADEESVVSGLSNGLMMVLQDNPDLSVWFVNHLCESADDA